MRVSLDYKKTSAHGAGCGMFGSWCYVADFMASSRVSASCCVAAMMTM